MVIAVARDTPYLGFAAISSPSPLRFTTAVPPFCNLPNSISSASGFLMSSSTTRAMGRAPMAGLQLLTPGNWLYNLFSEPEMRRIRKTKRYHKSLKDIPYKDQDLVEAGVDRLEGEWKGLDFAPIQGTKDWWRLSIGNYRVFCKVQVKTETHGVGAKTITIRVQEIEADEVARRSSTTYRKRD